MLATWPDKVNELGLVPEQNYQGAAAHFSDTISDSARLAVIDVPVLASCSAKDAVSNPGRPQGVIVCNTKVT